MEKIIINMTNNCGFRWFEIDKSWVKGYLFDSKNRLYKDSELLSFFDFEDANDLTNKLHEANGSFAAVIEKEDMTYIICDRLRSIPLYYSKNGEYEFYITDQIESIKHRINLNHLQNNKVEEFKLTGYTVGNTTLIKEIKQVQAGELILINNNTLIISCIFYYYHLHDYNLNVTYKKHLENLDSISNNVFNRLLESVNNRMIVVPLSGGYDSRYIAGILKRLDYKNVVCFTYGRKDSHEVITSKVVAEKLNFKWHYIEYDSDGWEQLFQSKGLEYLQFSHNYSSLPHIQEFIAMDYLKKNKLIDNDAIIVPGFCGDLLGGSFLIPDNVLSKISLNSEELSKYIFEKHFNLKIKPKSKVYKDATKEINNFICNFRINSKDDLISINEHFFTLHKVAKFIVNSVRVYEFFGYQWRLPLWDNELMDYWYNVPNSARINNKLYNEYLFECVFQKYNISIKKYESDGKLRLIKNALPIEVRNILLYIINKYLLKNKRNINSFTEIKEKIYQHTSDKSDLDNIYINENINHFLSNWLLENINKLDKYY